jgi:hypothetical protein
MRGPIAVVFLFSVSLAAVAYAAPVRLRCESIENPLGIDVPAPGSWSHAECVLSGRPNPPDAGAVGIFLGVLPGDPCFPAILTHQAGLPPGALGGFGPPNPRPGHASSSGFAP